MAFTDRHGGVSAGTMGSLNLGRTDVDSPAATRENYARVKAALGVERAATVHQVHGIDVVVVDDSDRWHQPDSELGDSVVGGRKLIQADGLVTREPGIALCIRIADCVPVLFADREARVVGAAHAGRNGLAAGVLQSVIDEMVRQGADDIHAWIGPHVCGACYEVPISMAEEVASVIPETRSTTRRGTAGLDLGAGARAVLERRAVRVTHVGDCTLEDANLHSHRRDGAEAGRLAGLVWLAQ